MFTTVPAKIGPNAYSVPYCIVSHVFERNGHTCHIDKAQRVIPHRILNYPIVPIAGNQLIDGVIRHDDLDPAPPVYVMTYHPVMDDPLAQRALNLIYPLHVCYEAFVMTIRMGGNPKEIPDTVMGLTGIDIQKEVMDLIVDASNRSAARQTENCE
jgi:hypothetical protein